MPTTSPPPSPSLACPPPAAAAIASAPAARPIWLAEGNRWQLRSLGKQMGWIAVVCALMALAYAPLPWRDPRAYSISLLYSFSYFAGLWLANGYTVTWLNQRLSWGDRPLRRLVLTVLASFVASALMLVLVPETYSVLLWHHRPGYTFRHGLMQQSAFPLLITLIISLFLHSRSFLLSWREATVRAERLEKESAVARLDSLRRQVDPHFLFNSLNALTSLVEEAEPARAVRFIRQLSSVYRYVLDSQSQELVPLAEELAFAEAYVYLQQTRLGDALQAALPAAAAAPPGLYLPPLALQLLLENALKHNTAFQREPLRLQVHLDATARTLTVRNTLRPRPLPPGETSGRGLANLRARYAFLTPRPLVAAAAAGEFVVTLPLLEL